MDLIKPNKLKEGDNIAIILPSSPVSSMKAIQASFPIFEKYGLNPILGPNVKNMRNDSWASGSVEDRVKEITWAFTDDSIQGIIAAEGGYSCMELLPHLPYKAIHDSAKPFMGMSDITALNTAILTSAGLVNFSGPNVRIRQDFINDAKNFEDALELMMTNEPWESKPFYRNAAPTRTVCEGIVKGISLGGNMTLFCSLIGTPYFPDVEDSILFFEDVHAGGYEVSMNLNRLELAGVLDKISGVVFGEFLKQPSRGDKDFAIEDVIVNRFKDRIPCIYGLSFSHGDVVANIPLGVETSLDADTGIVKFDSPFNNTKTSADIGDITSTGASYTASTGHLGVHGRRCRGCSEKRS